ncbi:S26 family signal peptidase [[Eubacterium] cellulosolvens]
MHGSVASKANARRDTGEDIPPEKNAKNDYDKKKELKQNLISTCKEFMIWVIIILIILGSFYGYAGRWPPVVVVESNSMMHGEDSTVGTMDTGDLVIVKKVSSKNDITTYAQGLKDNYERYNAPGDVVAFKKNGGTGIEVIHRAVVWIVYNSSGFNGRQSLRNFGSFDIPSLGLYNITNFTITNYKSNNSDLTIDLIPILQNFQEYNRQPHGGLLTKGDNNDQIDQLSDLRDSKKLPLEPVRFDWVVGKANGEIPWLGLINLFLAGKTSEPGKSAPATSVNMLCVTIVSLIILIIIFHLTFLYIDKKRRKRREEEEEKQLKPFYEKVSKRTKPESSKTPGLPAKDPRVTSKQRMVRYLDSIIEVKVPTEDELKKVKTSSEAQAKPEKGQPQKLYIPEEPRAASETIKVKKVTDGEMMSYLDTALDKPKPAYDSKKVKAPTIAPEPPEMPAGGQTPQHGKLKKHNDKEILSYLDDALK